MAPDGRRPVRRHGADHASTPPPTTTPTRTPTARRCRCQDPAAAAQLGRGRHTNEPLRQERIEADYATTPAQNATGGAIISTRDAVTFGFGLEQVDAATRSELLKRSLSYLRADHGRHHGRRRSSATSSRRPNSMATPADPIEVDVTAYDDRGDMKQVNLYADGALVGTVPVFPFQFRYTPPASTVGTAVKLTAEAVDKAGNKSTRDLFVNVARRRRAGRCRRCRSTRRRSSARRPSAQTMTCINGGFLNSPRSYTYAWLRNGAAIAGATAIDLHARPPPTSAARSPAGCSATNAAGTR